MTTNTPHKCTDKSKKNQTETEPTRRPGGGGEAGGPNQDCKKVDGRHGGKEGSLGVSQCVHQDTGPWGARPWIRPRRCAKARKGSSGVEARKTKHPDRRTQPARG